MLEAFYIPSPVLAAMAGGFALPLILLVFSHTPLLINKYSRRYWSAVLVVSVFWISCVSSTMLIGEVTLDQIGDVLAGLLVLITIFWIGFSAWCLLVWGFTISMLLRITEQSEAISIDQWIESYSGEKSFVKLTGDRLALILNTGLAHQKGDVIVLTPWGCAVAKLLNVGIWFFDIKGK
jgi:hypothetical protein